MAAIGWGEKSTRARRARGRCNKHKRKKRFLHRLSVRERFPQVFFHLFFFSRLLQCSPRERKGEEVGRIEVYEAKTDQLAARQADLQTSEKLAQALELLTTQLTQVAFRKSLRAEKKNEEEEILVCILMYLVDIENRLRLSRYLLRSASI